MQPRGAPGPGPSFSQGNLLGRPAHPSRLPGRVSPLIPVLRKTVRLDAFSQSYIPQAPGASLGAQARSVLPQETGNSLGPRKLSSISLTLRPNSQAWEEVPTLGKKAAVHGRGTMPTPESPSLILVPGGRVHSEGPGNPGLAKPSRMPVMEKPLVSSHLALPFQPRLAQDPPGPAGPGPAGQRHPVPAAAQVPARASPGRGRPRPRGTLRPRLHLQRTIPTMAPARAMDLVTLDTMGGTVRHSATMATNSPSLAVNLATSHTPRLDTGTEFPALDAKLGTATELATEGTAKQGLVTNPVTPDPDKLGKAIATAGTAKPYTTTGATAEDLAAPDPVKLGTARPDGVLALDRADPARRDITTGSPALHTSRLGICMGSVVPAPLNPAIGETTLDSAIHLTTLDTTTYPPMRAEAETQPWDMLQQMLPQTRPEKPKTRALEDRDGDPPPRPPGPGAVRPSVLLEGTADVSDGKIKAQGSSRGSARSQALHPGASLEPGPLTQSRGQIRADPAPGPNHRVTHARAPPPRPPPVPAPPAPPQPGDRGPAPACGGAGGAAGAVGGGGALAGPAGHVVRVAAAAAAAASVRAGRGSAAPSERSEVPGGRARRHGAQGQRGRARAGRVGRARGGARPGCRGGSAREEPAPRSALQPRALSISREERRQRRIHVQSTGSGDQTGSAERHKGVERAAWLPETRTDAAMSELVPEPRPKPAVPMKPVSINANLLGYIGIDTIIEQMRKKTMKTGFDFNIMVVGQSGLGKSTLVNTLFKSQVSRKSSSWSREEKIPKTVEIKAVGHVIEEGGVKMKLTVIDTPGFGDQINNENCWEPIEKYINEQYEKFLKEEVNIARKKRIPDTRVHCCLYFISPTGHSLRPLDLEFMKHLSKVVNIIPVIAKADTMTLEEKSEFKQRVRKELEVHGIEFYPQKEFDEDLEDKTENDKIRVGVGKLLKCPYLTQRRQAVGWGPDAILPSEAQMAEDDGRVCLVCQQESMPFAVVGSDKEYQVNGKRVLGRKTPWGIIEVENLHHCEFALLRDFVIRTHLQDLKEVTHNIHYETYRAKRLNDNGGLPPVSVDTEGSHDSNP
ncbi:hypothetical protein QTO34_018086 [Cnephaeus nilssonii]|uniref:Septin-type G domain-containing protein n=1 Tax=Cnephaeus nilssonii TaxID=3371016 RepID=A0AA40LS52_CNENI|nr:hypothetical protein QTO34_018086 [Eptesicus nilssonii]